MPLMSGSSGPQATVVIPSAALKVEFDDIWKLLNPWDEQLTTAQQLKDISKKFESNTTLKFHKSLTVLSTGIDVQAMATTVGAARIEKGEFIQKLQDPSVADLEVKGAESPDWTDGSGMDEGRGAAAGGAGASLHRFSCWESPAPGP